MLDKAFRGRMRQAISAAVNGNSSPIKFPRKKIEQNSVTSQDFVSELGTASSRSALFERHDVIYEWEAFISRIVRHELTGRPTLQQAILAAQEKADTAGTNLDDWMLVE